MILSICICVKGEIMEYVVLAVAVVLFLIVISAKGYYDYQNELKRFTQKLYMEYGVLPHKDYKPEYFKRISGYYRKHQESFHIDDITWNDLNMDEVFKKLNYTYSAAGEEYLYYTLRTLLFDENELKRREEIVSYFKNNSEDRAACQLLFYKMGGCGKFSIYDYLDYMDNLGERSNIIHYFAIIAILASVGIMFVNLPIGLLLMVLVFVFNILKYFKIKSEIDPYITSFSYIFKLLKTVSELQKISIPVLSNEWKELRLCTHNLNGFKSGSYLLMSSGRMSGSGNPLEIFLDYLRMLLHLDLIQFNRMLIQVRNHIAEIDRMVTIIGMTETMIAIGAFREKYECYCIPQFGDDYKVNAVNLYHPLLDMPVKNDINTKKSVLITGSNASGKSTFLKTVAINQIFAQTIHTCMADSYESVFFRIMSSMSLRDDIQNGDSYYIVEIKALKRIMDEAKQEGFPVLCFVDEVLRGTNTIERIAASVQILKSLTNSNSMCFAATHDMELTHILENNYKNYHFQEEIEGEDIYFSYKIMTGRATTRNAIKLLGIMGYDETIIRTAEIMANDFLTTGSWKGDNA